MNRTDHNHLLRFFSVTVKWMLALSVLFTVPAIAQDEESDDFFFDEGDELFGEEEEFFEDEEGFGDEEEFFGEDEEFFEEDEGFFDEDEGFFDEGEEEFGDEEGFDEASPNSKRQRKSR